MKKEIVLSPLLRVSRLDADQRLTIHAGRGDNREHLALEGPQSDAVLSWLLSQTVPRTGVESAQVLADKAGLDVDDAVRFIEAFVKAEVLVDEATAAELGAIIKRWGEHGWRDAVDFHLTTYGTTFVPDSADGCTYIEHFTELLANPGAAGPQPEHHEPRSASAAISWVGDSPGGKTLQEVLEIACPINRFTGIDVTLADFLPPMTDAFATQRVVGGTLGAHQLRSYPSGGARHPFEAYIVSKGIDGLEAGSYYFDTLTHELQPVKTDLDPTLVDRACFGKRRHCQCPGRRGDHVPLASAQLEVSLSTLLSDVAYGTRSHQPGNQPLDAGGRPAGVPMPSG